MLSERRDALGTPEIKLDWRVCKPDIDAIPGVARTLRCGSSLARNRASDRTRKRLGARNHRRSHHMGTTRMSADPRTGVVDEHCRVHSVDNLYIAGSSVFTTGGYANPTFTLLALALRLADTLRSRLGANRAGVVTRPTL
jgi:choline dehydrogenase-like flavoprotein